MVGVTAIVGREADSRSRGMHALLLFLIWLVPTLMWLAPGMLMPDGAGYYVYLPSTWLDGDLLFFDEWQRLGLVHDGVILHKEVTATDHLGNHWTCGAALAWLPSFIVADFLDAHTHLGRHPGNDIASQASRFPRNGFSLPYNVAVIFTSALAGLLAMFATWKIARRAASPRITEEAVGMRSATLAAACGWLATPLLWYSLRNSTMAHAISSCACAVAVLLAMQLRERWTSSMLLLAGAAIGFAAAVRPQNGTLAIVPLLLVPMAQWRRELRRTLLLPLGIAIGLLPEVVVSTFLYGTPLGFATGGARARPFASLEKVWSWEPLFSWYHGLFTWTPFALVGVVGLLLLWRRDRRLAAAGLLVFASQWIINALGERSFWGGYSFGARRFDNCLPFFVLGAAVVFELVGPTWGIVIAAAAIVWNIGLVLAASHGLDMVHYVTPAMLTEHVVSALGHLARDVGFLVNVPPEMRGYVIVICFLIALMTAFVAAVMSGLLRRHHFGAIAAMAIAVLLGDSLFLFRCGRRDAAHLPRYRILIEQNRYVADLPGGADIRTGLLLDEADFLRRTGRESEAQRTEAELRSLLAERSAAVARMTQRGGPR